MDSEFENKPQSESTANEKVRREGYTPAGGYQKSYRPVTDSHQTCPTYQLTACLQQRQK